MNNGVEKAIKKLFNAFGLEVTHKWNSPVGEMECFLRDLKKRGLKFNYILDVGAYRGKFSKLAISVYPESVVYMVEPLKEMKQVLEEFCRNNSKCKFFGFAVGPANGMQSLRVFKDLAWSGFMEEDIPQKDKLLRAWWKC